MTEAPPQLRNRLARTPAFPVAADACSSGMSLRDYIAIQLYIGNARPGSCYHQVADDAIAAANLLIEQLQLQK